MASKLTFITTTGSRLDDDSVKLMRGHVTRENFLQRRRRKALKTGHRSATETDRPNPTAGDISESLPESDVVLGSRSSVTSSLPLTISSPQYPPALIAYCMKLKSFLICTQSTNLLSKKYCKSSDLSYFHTTQEFITLLTNVYGSILYFPTPPC